MTVLERQSIGIRTIAVGGTLYSNAREDIDHRDGHSFRIRNEAFA